MVTSCQAACPLLGPAADVTLLRCRRSSERAAAGPRLTAREMEVASLVSAGLTNHSIAVRLSIAPRTAGAHVENIRRKLGVRSRAQITAWVTEHRLSTR